MGIKPKSKKQEAFYMFKRKLETLLRRGERDIIVYIKEEFYENIKRTIRKKKEAFPDLKLSTKVAEIGDLYFGLMIKPRKLNQ